MNTNASLKKSTQPIIPRADDTSIADEDAGIQRDILQRECERLTAVVAYLAYERGYCRGCFVHGKPTHQSAHLNDHVAGCYVVAALQPPTTGTKPV